MALSKCHVHATIIKKRDIMINTQYVIIMGHFLLMVVVEIRRESAFDKSRFGTSGITSPSNVRRLLRSCCFCVAQAVVTTAQRLRVVPRLGLPEASPAEAQHAAACVRDRPQPRKNNTTATSAVTGRGRGEPRPKIRPWPAAAAENRGRGY